jgi:DNA-binding CsgD family transcriptional regulator
MNGKRQAEWRRNQVLELTSKGHTQTEISNFLQISISTISRDLSSIEQNCKL